MPGRTIAGRPIKHIAATSGDRRAKLRERADIHGRMGRQNNRRMAGNGDVIHACQRMDTQPIAVKPDIECMRPKRANQERIAIRRCLRDGFKRHSATARRPVFHHELLTQLLRQRR